MDYLVRIVRITAASRGADSSPNSFWNLTCRLIGSIDSFTELLEHKLPNMQVLNAKARWSLVIVNAQPKSPLIQGLMSTTMCYQLCLNVAGFPNTLLRAFSYWTRMEVKCNALQPQASSAHQSMLMLLIGYMYPMSQGCSQLYIGMCCCFPVTSSSHLCHKGLYLPDCTSWTKLSSCKLQIGKALADQAAGSVAMRLTEMLEAKHKEKLRLEATWIQHSLQWVQLVGILAVGGSAIQQAAQLQCALQPGFNAATA